MAVNPMEHRALVKQIRNARHLADLKEALIHLANLVPIEPLYNPPDRPQHSSR